MARPGAARAASSVLSRIGMQRTGIRRMRRVVFSFGEPRGVVGAGGRGGSSGGTAQLVDVAGTWDIRGVQEGERGSGGDGSLLDNLHRLHVAFRCSMRSISCFLFFFLATSAAIATSKPACSGRDCGGCGFGCGGGGRGHRRGVGG